MGRRSSSSTALVRRPSSGVVVIRQGASPAKKKKGHRRRSRFGGDSIRPLSSKAKTWGMAWAWGKAKGAYPSQLSKIPRIASIGLEGTLAIGLHYLGPKAARAVGMPALAKWGDHLSEALGTLALYAHGRTGALTVSGDDDLSGGLGDDELGEWEEGDEYDG
jgi:hypothetical protein